MKKYLAVLLLVFTVNLSAQEVLDRVVAVVDKEIILESELNFQVSYEAVQKNLDPKDLTLQKRILNLMIDDKLLYAQAELDSIVISNEEVDRQLDYQLNFFIKQYGSTRKS